MTLTTQPRNQSSRSNSPLRWLVGALVLLSITGFLVLRKLGDWLALDEPLRKAQAIVVLGGGLPFRPMEAAKLYKEGWAPEIWLTRGELTPESQALAQLGFDELPEHEMSRLVLQRLGVPPASIRVLPAAVVNTLAEMRLAAQQAPPGSAVIVVASKSQARRVRVIWRAIAPDRSVIVRYASEDPFDPSRWWRTSSDVLSVARESLGIVNAWIGFPIAPREVTRTASSAIH